MTHDLPDPSGMVVPGILRSLEAESLAALAAGGTDPQPTVNEDPPVTLTTEVAAALLAAAHFAVDYGGDVHLMPPCIVIECPWANDLSKTTWIRRLRQQLLIACNVDIGTNTAGLDGWTITVTGSVS